MVSQYPFIMYRSQGRTPLARLSPGGAGSASRHYTLAQESPSALQGRPPPVFQNTPTILPRQLKAPSLQPPRSHQSQGRIFLYPLLDCDRHNNYPAFWIEEKNSSCPPNHHGFLLCSVIIQETLTNFGFTFVLELGHNIEMNTENTKPQMTEKSEKGGWLFPSGGSPGDELLFNV